MMRIRPFLVISIAVGGCTATEPQPNNLPITTFLGSTAIASCPTPHPKTVLIDPTHDGGTWWFPQPSSAGGEFDPSAPHQGLALANYLRGRGYTVTELGRGATMARDSMLTYAVIIRAAYYYSDLHPGYSADDLGAYATFAGCQRTLIVFGDFLDSRHDPLAESFGISFAGRVSGSITSFATHPITGGVTSVPYIAGSFLSTTTTAGIQVLGSLGTGEAVMGLVTNRAAKIFFLGDINGIEGMPQPLVSNLFAWGF